MADNLHHEVLFKICFCSPTMRLQNYLMINKLFFLVIKKRHFEEFCIGCIQVLTHQKKIHIFGKRTELLGIIGFTRTRLKNRPSFLFILKQQLIVILAQRETSPVIYFGASVLLFHSANFLRFLKSKYANFFHYFSKQCSS